MQPRDIAYLPQAAEIDRSFPISVYDMVAMGLWHRAGLFGGIDRTARTRSNMRSPPSASTASRAAPISTLSGGQIQRMLFARLLLQDARVIVLDEPFNAIDAKTMADLLDVVRRWHQEKRTVLAALHDVQLVKANFPADAFAGAPVGSLGRHRGGADAGKSADGAPDVRGLPDDASRAALSRSTAA